MELRQAQAPSCGPDGHCATCGDDAVEVVVIELRADDLALAALRAETLEVDISLVDAVEPGDRLLVHGGVALARL